MAEWTQLEIIAALQARIEAVDDVGEVLTDRRTVEGEEAEGLTLLMSLNSGVAHGWLITLVQINESATENACEIRQVLVYSLEAIYPYQRLRADDSTSESGFRAMLGGVFAALRESADLGLDNRIYHNFLQTDEDFSIKSWEGTGADALITHYARLRLEVVNAVFI